MPDSDLNPAQEKFFSRHINKGLLGKLRIKKDLAFADAFRSFTDADKMAKPLLTNLPMYPNGSAELAEKNALMERYRLVQETTLAKTKNRKTAIAACQTGKTDLEKIATDARTLMSKALTDKSIEDPERITLLKQMAALHLNKTREGFGEKQAPVLADIAEKTGTKIPLPVGTSFEAELALLRAQISAVKTTDQTAKSAKQTLDKITTAADQLLARKLAELNSFATSDAFAQTIVVGQTDAQLHSAISIAKANAEQMAIWNIPDAKAFDTETGALSKRATILFAHTSFTSKPEAESAIAARTALLSEVEALNAKSAKAIQDKKFAFGQLFRDVEARFATVERAFRDIDDDTFAKGQKEPITDFLSLTRTAINDLNGYNTDALVAAKKLVDQAATIVTNAQKAAETNDRLKEQLAKMGSAIDHGTRKGNPLATKFADHKTEHAQLSKEWQAMLLSEATAAVRDFLTRVVADVQLSKAIDERRIAARTELAAAKADLKLFNTAYGAMLKAHGRKAKPYEGDLVNDLQSVEDWIETKTTLSFYDTIDSTLTRIRNNIAGLFSGLQATDGKSDDDIFAEALELQRELDKIAKQTLLDITDKGEKLDPAALANARASVDAQIAKLSVRNDLLAEDSAFERQKAEEAERKQTYKADARAYVKSIKDELKAADDLSALKHSEEDVQSHLDRINESIKLVDKGASVRAAQSELAFVTKAIDGIKARGPRTDKSKLDQIGTEWAAAVKDFEIRCTAMHAAVEKYLKDHKIEAEYASALTTLQTALSSIQSQLDPAAFIRAANRFRDAAQFKSAREEALQQVRYFNDLLLKDPVLQQCVMNPFGIRDFASPLASRLRQIELNVLRAA